MSATCQQTIAAIGGVIRAPKGNEAVDAGRPRMKSLQSASSYDRRRLVEKVDFISHPDKKICRENELMAADRAPDLQQGASTIFHSTRKSEEKRP
jgi:hypothetical protein